MKKLLYIIFILMFSLIFISCYEDSYYNVTFKVNQEETIIKVKENTKVTKPTDPIKENSEFKGWYLDNELYDFNTVVTKDITLVALFEGYYNVTFKVDQEETIITVKENTPITKPTDPVKEACEFKGWYLDNELYDFNTVVTKDITLVAKFSEIVPTAINITSSIGDEKFFVGDNMQLSLSFTPSNSFKNVIWTSSDESIATVDSNGKVTGVAAGTVTITATSLVDPSKRGSITFEVNNHEVEAKPESVTINGESEIYVGYSINLVATVAPTNAIQSVTWSSSNEEIATVDQTGKVTAIRVGTVRIKATSTVDSSVFITFKIEIIEMCVGLDPLPNMGGYKIVIMTDSDSLKDLDPFLEGYNGADKDYKRKAWMEAEFNYNCDIVVEAYPTVATWGDARIKWIVDNAKAGTSKCDLALVSSDWISEFATSSSAIDVIDYYKQYGLKRMEPSLKQAGTFQNKLYIASTGISPTATYVDLGLFYDLTWVQKLGVNDPAYMFLDGKWNYSGFEEWIEITQSLLEEGQFAFGGHPYYYYYGMTNAAGVKIVDEVSFYANINSLASKAACDLIYELVKAGCCDEVASWAESDGGFIARTTVMTTGYLSYINNDDRWKANMFGDDTKIGYVPFPYPDNVEKENTRISVSSLDVLLYVAGRTYPAGVSTEEVYRAINDMFLNTIKYQKADADFDAEVVKRTALQEKIDHRASINCILYYDTSKVFYDPVHWKYDLPNGSDLKQAAIDVMYKGKDFYSSFDNSTDDTIIFR